MLLHASMTPDFLCPISEQLSGSVFAAKEQQ